MNDINESARRKKAKILRKKEGEREINLRKPTPKKGEKAETRRLRLCLNSPTFCSPVADSSAASCSSSCSSPGFLVVPILDSVLSVLDSLSQFSVRELGDQRRNHKL